MNTLCAGGEPEVAAVDAQFEGAYAHLVRRALDVSLCLEGGARVEGPKQDMVVRLAGASEDAWPLSLTNDFDLAALFAAEAPAAPAPLRAQKP